jgi:hypothetical protein
MGIHVMGGAQGSGTQHAFSLDLLAEIITGKKEGPDLREMLHQLVAYFALVENKRKLAGGESLNGGYSHIMIGTAYVYCMEHGIAPSKDLINEVVAARCRENLYELPEIERYEQRLREDKREALMQELLAIKEEGPSKCDHGGAIETREQIGNIRLKRGRRGRSGEDTDYIRNLCVKEGYSTVLEATRKIFEKISHDLSMGVDCTPFTDVDVKQDAFTYLAAGGGKGKLTRDNLRERLKKWWGKCPTLEERITSIKE